MDANTAFDNLIAALNIGHNQEIIENSAYLQRWVNMNGFIPKKALDAGFSKFGFELLLRSVTTEAIS